MKTSKHRVFDSNHSLLLSFELLPLGIGEATEEGGSYAGSTAVNR